MSRVSTRSFRSGFSKYHHTDKRHCPDKGTRTIREIARIRSRRMHLLELAEQQDEALSREEGQAYFEMGRNLCLPVTKGAKELLLQLIEGRTATDLMNKLTYLNVRCWRGTRLRRGHVGPRLRGQWMRDRAVVGGRSALAVRHGRQGSRGVVIIVLCQQIREVLLLLASLSAASNPQARRPQAIESRWCSRNLRMPWVLATVS